MIYTNENYKELFETNLCKGDELVFSFPDKASLHYIVQDCYCGALGFFEYILFIYLNIDAFEYCKEYYGYSSPHAPNKTLWPDFKLNDFAAATRFVIALFDLVMNQFKPILCLELTSINNGTLDNR